MRICLVSHGFPPLDRTGVENYTEALARAFVRAGHTVTVFAPRRRGDSAHAAVRREARDGYTVHWLALSKEPRDPAEALDSPAAARQFGRFLDRERPHVCHFQHVIKLGIGLLGEASERGIAVVYTAHDYFAVCHRYTLLRPDLRHCDVRGDSMACARCDVAVGWLNGIEGLGDWQAGALPSQLTDAQRAGLEGILADEPQRAGMGRAELDAAFDRRLALDALRARRFAQVDLLLAPSRYLAEELVRGGLERERIEVLPYGIENDDLRDLPPPLGDGRRPVRFAYFGGHSKQKGVHVLLEAFGRLAGEAELYVFGYATDEPYGRIVRELASEAGALWRGPYEREELPGLLAEVDVVCVPSLWVENQPIVVREAFSAGRPVIASDLGALPESVRDEVDGLLVPPGDVDAWASALERCLDRDLVRRLAEGIGPVTGVDEHAGQLLERYERILARPREEPELPHSLRAFAAHHRALEEAPLREVFEQVLDGLAGLRGALDPDPEAPAEDLLRRVLLGGTRAQDELRDAREERSWMDQLLSESDRERTWLRDVVEGHESERSWLQGVLRARESEKEWLRNLLESHGEEKAWLQETLAAKERELAARTEEVGWLREKEAASDEELAWLREKSAAGEEELAWLRDKEVAREKELAWLREQGEARLEEVSWLRERLDELDRGRRSLLEARGRVEEALAEARTTLDAEGERRRSTAELGLSALDAQERALEREVAPVLAVLGVELLAGEPEGRLARLVEALREGAARAEGLLAELDWRRAEMERALVASRRGLARLVLGRTGLGRAVSSWEPGSGTRDGEAAS